MGLPRNPVHPQTLNSSGEDDTLFPAKTMWHGLTMAAEDPRNNAAPRTRLDFTMSPDVSSFDLEHVKAQPWASQK
jgi:hypothetical protein